jgi:hypothetical protein
MNFVMVITSYYHNHNASLGVYNGDTLNLKHLGELAALKHEDHLNQSFPTICVLPAAILSRIVAPQWTWDSCRYND